MINLKNYIKKQKSKSFLNKVLKTKFYLKNKNKLFLKSLVLSKKDKIKYEYNFYYLFYNEMEKEFKYYFNDMLFNIRQQKIIHLANKIILNKKDYEKLKKQYKNLI